MLWLPQRAQLCESVSLVSLDWPGEGGVMGDHCGLSQSTYMEVSANGPISDSRKVAIGTLFLLIKGIMIFSSSPGYTFTFCLTKPVDIDLKIIFVVIQAHQRGFVA